MQGGIRTDFQVLPGVRKPMAHGSRHSFTAKLLTSASLSSSITSCAFPACLWYGWSLKLCSDRHSLCLLYSPPRTHGAQSPPRKIRAWRAMLARPRMAADLGERAGATASTIVVTSGLLLVMDGGTKAGASCCMGESQTQVFKIYRALTGQEGHITAQIGILRAQMYMAKLRKQGEKTIHDWSIKVGIRLPSEVQSKSRWEAFKSIKIRRERLTGSSPA